MKFKMNDPALLEKAGALLARMTLAEKAAQLSLLDAAMEGCVEHIKKDGAGLVGGVRDAALANELQRFAVEETRLGIPFLFAFDVIQGWRTIFPVPVAEACSFDRELIQKTSRAMAAEAQAGGCNLTFAPMLDIARDPRWGRIVEGAGEDPFLAGEVARARVAGYQGARRNGRRFAGCMKHFAAYGACEGGRDYTNNTVSERALREVYLPPFAACVDAGVEAVMPAFTDALGLPCSANPFLLRKILREEMGFEGLVISDYNAVYELISHGVAASVDEACKIAIEAGMDVDINDDIYLNCLERLVGEGAVAEETVDAAVLRVLYLKYALGLFDAPYCDETEADALHLSEEHLRLAREAVQKTAVLLKNDGALPIREGRRVAVVGPLADERDGYIGWWRGVGRAEDVVTVLEGLRARAGGANVSYAEGCGALDGGVDEAAVREAVDGADVIVAVLGETSQQSGEAHCRSDLELPGAQNELLALLSATGKPVVAVLVSGRPLSALCAAQRADAVLMAWEPGVAGGSGVADLLFGDCNPSGKLSVSIPRSAAQLPCYYNHFNTGRPLRNEGAQEELGVGYRPPYSYGNRDLARYLDAPHDALYPFGHGLSYSSFCYSELLLDKKELRAGETLRASVDVLNDSGMAGDEIVQLYVQDAAGSVVRPVRELKGFARVRLEPGERRRVTIELPAESLRFPGFDNRPVLESGLYRLWMAPDSVGGLMGTFTLVEA